MTATDTSTVNGQHTDNHIPVRPPLRDRLLTVAQLAQLPPVRPLIEGLIYADTLCQLSGAPGSYKSFLGVGMAIAVALGEPFEGHAVPTAGPVIYVAPEGASGLRARIYAYCELSKIDPARLDGRLLVLPEPVHLGHSLDITEALEAVTELGAVLVVLDTRARCTVGMEENSAKEQGIAIAAAERIVSVGCAVLLLHHASRNGTAGRGSNTWDGAVWSDLRVAGENLTATVTCAKHKDIPDGCEHVFRMVAHTVSEDLMPGCDEAQRSTLVAVQSDLRGDDRPDSKTGRFVREIVRDCAGPDGLTRPQIRDLVSERGVSRSQTYAAMNDLVKRGVLINISTGTRERFTLSPHHANIIGTDE